MLTIPETSIWVSRFVDGGFREIWNYSSVQPPRRVHRRRQARVNGSVPSFSFVMAMSPKTGEIAVVNSVGTDTKPSFEIEVLSPSGKSLRRKVVKLLPSDLGWIGWETDRQPALVIADYRRYAVHRPFSSRPKIFSKEVPVSLRRRVRSQREGDFGGDSRWTELLVGLQSLMPVSRGVNWTTDPRFGWTIGYNGRHLWRTESLFGSQKNAGSAWSDLRPMRYPRVLFTRLNPKRPFGYEDEGLYRQVFILDVKTGRELALGDGVFALCRSDGGRWLPVARKSTPRSVRR